MGLFDVFSKGGKYFGKAIEPRCEYCEFGKRAKDGDMVLCSKKGLVNSSDHCPKFTYSPLKRIPVKQMEKVGFLEGDYDEKNFDDEESSTEKDSKANGKKQESKAKPNKTASATAPAPAPAKAAADAVPAADDLAALAAAADAAPAVDDLSTLAAAADAKEETTDTSALSAM